MVETTDKSILVALARRSDRAGGLAGFNPVLRAERVVFVPHLRNVYVELDFFRSVFSGSWVLRRFYSQSGKVVVVYRHGLAAQKQSRSALEYRFSANRQCQRIP